MANTSTADLPAKAATGTRAQTNRRRILEVATQELIGNPDASMDDIAHAADVVRRTIYGHFPTREALIDAIADQAMAEINEAYEESVRDAASPAIALARSALALWPVGDRYRLLINLAERTSTGVHDRLAPLRDRLAALLEEGQRQGEFTTRLPAPALAYALEGLTMSLFRAVNDGVWTDPNPAVHSCHLGLITAGVPADRAAALIEQITDGG